MGNLLGGHKKQTAGGSQTAAAPSNPAAVITDQDRAILQLKVQRDRLHKYTGSLSLVIAREVAVAKELLRDGKKSTALLALKRKRYQETLLSRTEAQMLNLEELVHSIQFAAVQAQVFAALKQGNAVLEALNAQTRLEDVEALMDETREAVAVQQQISEALGAEITPQDVSDIESTIAQWEAEEQLQEMPDAPKRPLTVPEAAEVAEETTTQVAPSAKAPVTTKREVVLS